MDDIIAGTDAYVDVNFGFNAYRHPDSDYNCNIHEIENNENDVVVRFEALGNSCYNIRLANHPDYYLSANGSENGSDIRWRPKNNSNSQIWRLEAVDLSERAAITQTVVNNIQNCSTDIIPLDAKGAAIAAASAMLSVGYPISFVAGMLSNIVFEGTTGMFESSNYINKPKPAYLTYMDTEYNGENFYLNNYSGKTIMDVGVESTYTMLCDLNTRSNGIWEINNSKIGFGLGCIQWSFDRALKLVEVYREINNCSNTITAEQAAQAESQLILRELSSGYPTIIANWRNDNADALSSETAAYNAGKALCNNYIRPKDVDGSIATVRANRAVSIYAAITA